MCFCVYMHVCLMFVRIIVLWSHFIFYEIGFVSPYLSPRWQKFESFRGLGKFKKLIPCNNNGSSLPSLYEMSRPFQLKFMDKIHINGIKWLDFGSSRKQSEINPILECKVRPWDIFRGKSINKPKYYMYKQRSNPWMLHHQILNATLSLK